MATEGKTVQERSPGGGIRGSRSAPSTGCPTPSGTARLWHQAPLWFLGNFQYFIDPDRLHRPGLRPVAGLDGVAGTVGIVVGTMFMAFHATQGPNTGPAADDPVARPVRLPGRGGAAVRDRVHLRRLQHRRPGAARGRACTAPSAGTPTWSPSSPPSAPPCWRSTATTGCTRSSAASVHPAAAGGGHHGRRDHRPRRAASPATTTTGSAGPASWPSSPRRRPTTSPTRPTSRTTRATCPRTNPRARSSLRVRRRRGARDLADRPGRLAGHPPRRDRRPGRPAHGRQQHGQPPRRDHRVGSVGSRAGRDDGHERLRRHADDPDRRRTRSGKISPPGGRGSSPSWR